MMTIKDASQIIYTFTFIHTYGVQSKNKNDMQYKMLNKTQNRGNWEQEGTYVADREDEQTVTYQTQQYEDWEGS